MKAKWHFLDGNTEIMEVATLYNPASDSHTTVVVMRSVVHDADGCAVSVAMTTVVGATLEDFGVSWGK